MNDPTHEEMLQMEIDSLKDQISKANCQTYIWDDYTPAPTEELQKITRKVNNEIKHQPYFGESANVLMPKKRTFDKSKTKADYFIQTAMCKGRYKILQKQAEKMREIKRNRRFNIIEWADKYIKEEDKMPKRNEENECNDQCTSYVEMETKIVEPETCQNCIRNPQLADNFKQKEMPWPPEKGQKIWCISATGQVYKREYDSEFKSTVMCYVTEHLANGALDTLLRARGR